MKSFVTAILITSGVLLIYFAARNMLLPAFTCGAVITALVIAIPIQGMRPVPKKIFWGIDLLVGGILMGIDLFLIPNVIHIPDHIFLILGFVMIMDYLLFSDR